MEITSLRSWVLRDEAILESRGSMIAPQPVSRTSSILGRALGWSALASAAILLVNIGTGILLARALGPELRGALAAAILWPSLLGGLGLLGLMESVSYHSARREMRDGELLGSALTIGAGLSVAVTVLTAAILPLGLIQQTEQTLRDAYIYLAYIPINIMTLVLAGYVNGRQRFAWFQVVRVAVVVATGVGLCGAAFTDHLDVRTALVVYLAASLVSTGLAIVMVTRLLADRLRFKRTTAQSLLQFGLRSFASTAAWRSNERLDQPIIAALLPPAQLGLYVIAVTFSSLAGLVGSSVVFVGLPAIAAVTDSDQRQRLGRALVGLTLGASVVLTLPLVVAVEPLLGLLFGPEFAVVSAVARILLVASIVLSVNRAIEAVLTGVGRPSDAARAEIMALPVTAVGLAVLLPTLGLVGAGWASLAAYLTAFMFMGRRAGAALDTSWHRLLVPDRRDVDALVGRWRAARVHAGG